MKGIKLKDSIKQFGFKSGFGFWFRWSFTDPTKIFYLKYIIAKPLCTYHGYFGHCSPDCQHKKIIGRKNIIRYEKERHKQIEKEMDTIICGPNGECAYCGEEKGTELIDNPNMDTFERWKVCKTCKEVIDIQRELAFLSISKIDNPKRAVELNERLLEISKKTGKPIISFEIRKNKDGTYESSSIEFGGKNG